MKNALQLAAALLAGSLACAPCAAEEPAVPWPELPLSALAQPSIAVNGEELLDVPRPRLEARPQVRGESSFVQRHLVPRLSKQFRRLAPIHTPEWDELPFRQSSLGIWLEDTAEYRAGRAFGKATRDFLLEASGVSELIESIHFGYGGSGDGNGGWGFDGGLRISHGQPNVELRYRGRIGSVRVGVSPSGSTGIEYRPQSWIDARVVAGYDADRGHYRLDYRYTF